MSSKGTIIVTGGAGFVGAWIVKAILEQMPSYDILVLDKHFRKQDIIDFSAHSNVDTQILDITDKEAVSRVFDAVCNPVAVVHSAGIVPNAGQRYDTSRKAFDRCYAVNVEGTRNVLDAAKSAGVRAFVYTSSVTVLVDDLSIDHPNMNEDVPTGSATLPYGRTKAMAEDLVLAANTEGEGMQTCALRPSVIFGPGDENCIPTLYSCIAKGETKFVIGDAMASLYDFTYVTNVADAHVFALRKLLGGESTAAGKSFFITNGSPIPFRTFCLAVWAGFGHVPKYEIRIPLFLAFFVGWMMEAVTRIVGGTATLSRGAVRDLNTNAYCDLEKARDVLGYEPRVGMEEGIRLSCEDYLRRMGKTREGKKIIEVKKEESHAM